LLVYVDDIVLTSNNPTLIQHFVDFLDRKFTIKYLRLLHFFLGIEVTQLHPDLLLTQSKYIYSILDKAKMQRSKPINTSMATGQVISKFVGEPMADPHLFRNIIEALQYITIT
jgi:Reverse transcriptase (RNA-dependent DNA polymerase)